MKFIYVSDLHSNKLLYSALEKLIAAEKADTLIIGGDLFAYSPKAEPQIEFAEEFFYGFLKDISIPVYIIPGNCDKQLTIKYLKKYQDSGLVTFLTLTGTVINNIEFVGYEYIPPSPFKIKDWERRDLIGDSITFEGPCLLSDNNDKLNLVPNNFLNHLPSIEEEISLLNNKKSIWVMHSPPFGGILDKNDANVCCGSKAIRNAIERVQPILTLHGHIHESPYVSQKWHELIGDTVSVNPGCGEALQAVIFEINKNGCIVYIKHNLYGTAS